MTKMEIGQAAEFTASGFTDSKGNPALIEAGSATWGVSAQDPDGNDVSGEFDVTVVPEFAGSQTESRATVRHTGKSEAVGSVVFTADGDPDADEEQLFKLSGALVVDSPNATGGTITGVVIEEAELEGGPELTPAAPASPAEG